MQRVTHSALNREVTWAELLQLLNLHETVALDQLSTSFEVAKVQYKGVPGAAFNINVQGGVGAEMPLWSFWLQA